MAMSRGTRGRSGPRRGGRTASRRRSEASMGRRRTRFKPVDGKIFVDWKDVETLRKLLSPQGKLFSARRLGHSAAWQRAIKRAVKRARFMALLPYVGSM